MDPHLLSPFLRRRASFLPTLLLAAGSLSAQALHVRCEAEVAAGALATSGRAVLRLTFVAEAQPTAPHTVRVELRGSGRLLSTREHAPPIPTTEWRPDEPVRYELPLFFPLLPEGIDTVDVWLGFYDPKSEELTPPLTRGRVRDGMARVATFAMPELPDEIDAEAVDATIESAEALARKDPSAAWDQLEFAFRRTEDYELKARLRQALLRVGRMPPAPLSFEEEGIVAGRIRAERARYLRQVAGRLYDRKKLFAALILLDEVGGRLQEDADRAVLGALRSARRVSKSRDAIADELFAIDDGEKREVDRLIVEHRGAAERLAAARKLATKRETRRIARELLRTIDYLTDPLEEAAIARREIERGWLDAAPPDQRKAADAALNHPCWARTTRRASHRFVLIGPKTLLDGIPADSLLRFDLAYLYLTDLFGRVPNPEGDRVTVYFKELWSFGGGIGGGKIIDVGRADPKRTDQRVDGGLFYHELTHCIDDTAPIYPGFREGLADFGAAFAYRELGQIAAARAAFGVAQRAFLGDYVERDLEYWRIPSYGPSAGFLLHFVQTYGKDGNDYEWWRYRRFFRAYRHRRVDDARTPTLAREFAYHLIDAFGEEAFADLVRFRWPLLPDDLEAVRLEQKAAFRSSPLVLDEHPGSPVPRDKMAASLLREGAGPSDYHDELGVVTDWQVIGPFRKKGVDSDAYRFPPEREIDLAARYESINNNPTWRRPGRKPVTVDDTGWLRFHFSYMDDSAIYALSHVRVEEPVEAWFWLRADDDVTLFVGDELVGKYAWKGGSTGPWRPGVRTLLPDAIRFPVTLRPGRTKVLVKVRNRRGGSGFALAIARRNGTPLDGWSTDAEPPREKLAAIDIPDPGRWRSRFRLNGTRAGAHRKLDVRVGRWRARNRAIEGTSTDRGVQWRKYTVRPGFPKDSPSNLAWLPEKATREIDAFDLKIAFESGSGLPKVCVILQGDGGRDALGGWTLVLVPRGGTVQARLERYDRLVYQSDRIEVEAAAKKPLELELTYYARRLSVRLGDRSLFDQAPIRPIPDRDRIGIATWAPSVRITGIELRAPARTR